MAPLKKILAVDDDPEILRLLEKRLRLVGYEVITTTNGNEAVDLARRELPNLVILDILMPGMDGSEVAAKLYEDPKTKEIPVLFLTCLFTKTEEKFEGHEFGRHYFVAKPFDPKDLLNEVAKIIR